MTDRDDPRAQFTDKKSRLIGDFESENILEADYEAITELLDALDPERPSKVFHANGNGAETKATKTLANYTTRLRLAAREVDEGLLNQTTDSINELMGDMATGRAEVAPEDGYAKGTVGQYQSALKAFYRYHNEHDVDPESIPVFAPEDTTVDERDMFTVDEIQAMREAIDSPRERCLFELLAFTGQRIRVIQTLRIKDIDLDEGILYINEEAVGLKGAKGKRPLLGAKAYVRRWLDYHPTKEPKDYLITPKATGGGTPGDMLTQDTIRYHLRKVADKAEVDKDVNPHVFRHYFTTIAKRDYGMDDAYIKHLRGDSPASNVMETTYRHLSDGDAVEHAKVKTGEKEPESESPLSPDTCPTCGEILEARAKACPTCGAVFTPDAKGVEERMHQSVKKSYREIDPEADTGEKIEALDDLLADPEVKSALLERWGEA